MKYLTVLGLATLALVLGLAACSSKENASTAPKQEYVIKNLVPAKADIKGADFQIHIEGLQVSMNVDAATKQPVETPRLAGNYKITNTSKDVLDVQGVTIEYLDQQGKVIPFSSGEKIAKASMMLAKINPGEVSEGTLDITFPKAALKDLGSIDLNLVFIPSPLKRETLKMPEKVE